MTVIMRKDGITGEVEIEGFGSEVHFSEWYNGDGYDFEVSRGSYATQKFDLTVQEIYAIAKMGAMANVFFLNDLAADVEKSKEHNRKLDETLTEIRSKYSMPSDLDAAYDEAHRPITDMYENELVGGDGTPEYVAIEGWGIHKLDNGDFEVSYKV